MKKVWKWVVAIGGALIAAVAAVIAVSVVRDAFAKDRCGLPGIEDFDPERLPIYLVPSGELAGDRWVRSLWWAVDLWNGALGAKVFVLDVVDHGTICPVMPFPEWEDPGTAFGRARLTLTKDEKGIVSAAIYVDPIAAEAVTDEILGRALAHEMGHVLGLDHDDIEDSLMYNRSLPNEPYVTDGDIEFLREVYKLG